MTEQITRRPQVLVIPSEAVAALYARPGFYSEPSVLETVQYCLRSSGRFMDRSIAEADDSLKQVVACGIIHNGPRLLYLRRSRKSNRLAMRLRYTLMVGGHVDDAEVDAADPVIDCLLRELNEELGLAVTTKPALLGVVADPTTHVGMLHIGLVYDVEISQDAVVVSSKCDNAEFTNSGRSKSYPMASVAEITLLSQRFDMWSSLFLASEASSRMLGVHDPLLAERTLPLTWASQSKTGTHP